MSEKKPRGVYVALLTPMNDDETVNVAEMENQMTRMAAAGVDAALILGTNGEFFALSAEERISIMREAVRKAPPELRVCAGVGAVTTRDTVRLACEAETAGVPVLAVIAPYFVQLSQAQLERHFRDIAASTRLPIMLYNIPNRTGNPLSVETVVSLAEVSTIIGIKDSSGDLEYLERIIASVPEDFAVLVGSDGLILEALKAGAVGSVSGMANLVPEIVVKIYRSFTEGRGQDAAEAQERLTKARSILSLGNSNSIVKRAVQLAGQQVGPCRRPGAIADPEIDRKIIEILEDL